tara:strand:+ start:141 stop:1154 length:1014 start_codon:yes stop_codon:yes gene_type:complete
MYNAYMFNKLAPLPVENKFYRRAMIVGMFWFLGGAWLDASAHTYIDSALETFFTPWHAMLYSGYMFVFVFYIYTKHKARDYKFDVGLLGGAVFAVGGATDMLWHTFIGIEEGIEPLLSASHILLFLGAFLMLDHAFASRPDKNILDNTSIIAIASSYGLALFITQFMNPFMNVLAFFQYGGENEFVGAASVFIQAFIASYVFVYTIRFKPKSYQIFTLFLVSFIYLSIVNILSGDPFAVFNIVAFGSLFSYLCYQISKWYYKTANDRKIQIASSLVAGSYGLVVVLYVLFLHILGGLEPLTWRFYGLSGLVVTPMLFGYMIGNLGVSPFTGEVVGSS